MLLAVWRRSRRRMAARIDARAAAARSQRASTGVACGGAALFACCAAAKVAQQSFLVSYRSLARLYFAAKAKSHTHHRAPGPPTSIVKQKKPSPRAAAGQV